MILGVVIGESPSVRMLLTIGKFAPNVDTVLNGAQFEGVSARMYPGIHCE